MPSQEAMNYQKTFEIRIEQIFLRRLKLTAIVDSYKLATPNPKLLLIPLRIIRLPRYIVILRQITDGFITEIIWLLVYILRLILQLLIGLCWPWIGFKTIILFIIGLHTKNFK